MPSSRIPPQDPSMSPTFSMSTNQSQAPIASSIRRNLFASHLSRRPVAPTSFAPASPTYDAQPQPDLYAGPTLQPTKRSMSFQDVYDPNVSPSNHPISPSTSSTMFPRESIIAVHPVTGKPLLPNLPTLPPRLRLSEGDEEEEDSETETHQDQHIDYQNHGFARSPSFHNNLNLSSDLGFDPDVDSSELERMGVPPYQAHSHIGSDMVLDSNTEESHRDRERIERLLVDMQARQRARARTINPIPSNEANTIKPSSSSHAARAKRLPTGKNRERNNTDYHHSSSPTKHNIAASAELMTGGVGASMDPHEKDELMGLIMTSLRRKLQTAEEENWMYGGPDTLGGTSGMGLESDATGPYD